MRHDLGKLHNEVTFVNEVMLVYVSPNSRALSVECRDKWYVSAWVMGSDKDPVHRYLQEDGAWGNKTYYFDTKTQAEQALAHCAAPDFSLSGSDLDFRRTIREDTEQGSEERLGLGDGEVWPDEWPFV